MVFAVTGHRGGIVYHGVKLPEAKCWSKALTSVRAKKSSMIDQSRSSFVKRLSGAGWNPRESVQLLLHSIVADIGDGVAKGAYSEEELEQVTVFRVELQKLWHLMHETDPPIDPALLHQRLESLRAQYTRNPLAAFDRRMKRAVAKAEKLKQKRR